MKTRLTAAALLAFAAVLATTSCSRQEKPADPTVQAYCPVMTDQKIKPSLYVDADGKRIYVCCPGCLATVKADPGKYISEMEAKGIVLEETSE